MDELEIKEQIYLIEIIRKVENGEIKVDKKLAYEVISLLNDENIYNHFNIYKILYYYYKHQPNDDHELCYQNLKYEYSTFHCNYINDIYFYDSFNYYIFKLICDFSSPQRGFLYAYRLGLTRDIYNKILKKMPNILNEIKILEMDYKKHNWSRYKNNIPNNWMVDIEDTYGLEILIQDNICTMDEIIDMMFNRLTDISKQKKIIDLFLRKEWISPDSLYKFPNFKKYIKDRWERNDTLKNININYEITHIIKLINEFAEDDFNFEIFKILYKYDTWIALAYARTMKINCMQYRTNIDSNAEIINKYLIQNLIESTLIHDIMEQQYLCLYISYIKEEDVLTCIQMILNCGITATEILSQFQHFHDKKDIIIIKYLIDHGADIHKINKYTFNYSFGILNSSIIHYMIFRNPELAAEIEDYFNNRKQ